MSNVEPEHNISFVTITWINALILTKHIDALIDTQFTYALIDVVLTSDCNYISSYWCTIKQMTSMYLILS